MMGAGFEEPPMQGNMPPMNDGGDAMLNNGDMGEMPMDNTVQGGDPTMGNDNNQYDTNFDAGVEADEDADPKKYIQQLTGKLSQKLNSYNQENDGDEISKYVGKMIIKQVAKGLDDEAKRDLIKTIKTTKTNDELDMDLDDVDGNAEGSEDMEMMDDMEEPMNECRFSKKELNSIFESFERFGNDNDDKVVKPNPKKKSSRVFGGKKF